MNGIFANCSCYSTVLFNEFFGFNIVERWTTVNPNVRCPVDSEARVVELTIPLLDSTGEVFEFKSGTASRADSLSR